MRKCILLVDDDVDDRDIFSQAAEKAGAKCITISDGNVMLSKLRCPEISRPDIIFLDINMPMINGWQCLMQLKHDQNFKDIPVVMYSTSAHREDILKAKALGAMYFFTKPDDFAVLTHGLVVVVKHLESDSIEKLGNDAKWFK